MTHGTELNGQKKSDREHVRNLLGESLSPMEKVLLRTRLGLLSDRFFSFLSSSGRSFDPDAVERPAALLVEFLVSRIRASQDRITELHGLLAEFNTRYFRAVSEREKREHVLQLARRLGASGRRLRGDQEAFRRWFGYDTIVERVNRRISECEYELTFVLNVLGGVGPLALFEAGDPSAQDMLWNGFNLGNVLKDLLVFRGDPRVRIQAFKCLAGCVAALMPEVKKASVDAGTLALIYRSSLDASQHVWIQCEALKLLAVLDTDSFTRVLRQRLTQPGPGDDIFFRRSAVKLLGEHSSVQHELVDLIPAVLKDPSPYVRQGAALTLGSILERNAEICTEEQIVSWIRAAALHDTSAQVRAAMLTELTPARVCRFLEPAVELLSYHFAHEEDSFVLRAGLRSTALLVEGFAEQDRLHEAARLADGVIPSIETLHKTASDLSVRRWAAMARERVLIAVNPEAAKLKRELQEIVKGIKPGRSRRVSRSLIHSVDEELLGRVSAVMSQEDFGLSLRYGMFGPRIVRGDVFGFRFWRFLNELFSPSPDKRQGFKHTIGRKTEGDLRVPSAIVSELSQTKVPGEPLFMPSESGWRPYLPLTDDVLASAKRRHSKRGVKFFTAEGVTELKPPRNLIRRFIASVALTLRFRRYAGLRNWSEDADTKPDSYVRSLERLGFGVSYRGFDSDQGRDTTDPAVPRFFATSFPLIGFETWRRFSEYFVSAYENTLYQLGIFSAGLLVLFAGRHTYLGRAVRKARKSLDLVLGGWGTRGKSGTERLKTALIEALGHGLVAKTTGCEAMFLHAYPFGRTREMFIYRSYDKATIWEHHNIMRLTKELGCRIFLWECMGLNPSFVKILQRQWSIDDYSTITNTYPDHEDIQGPAGINIPEVMTNFIPKGRVLITSEQEMKPVLSAGAQELGTRLVSVGWLEAGLLTPDVLSRFPYEEHPANIALVLALAGELGIEPDFALKEMADRVVPDLGVLKVYPRAKIRGRRLEFVNGMSANERLATLSNWTRMGFDVIHPETHPGVMISTVVNNRADRLARSRVFASILVEDIEADRHFIIGSNVSGLMEFIKEAWKERSQRLSIRPRDDEDGVSPEEKAASVARRLRIPTCRDRIRQRLEAMLRGLDARVAGDRLMSLSNDPEGMLEELKSVVDSEPAAEIVGHVRELITRLQEYEEILSRIRTATPTTLRTIEEEFRELAGRWFMSRFVVMEDYLAGGDRIIDRIRRETPPGILNRVMGIQNIKGTGLDFVYRWVAWEQCHNACVDIRSDNRPEDAERSLSELAAFQDYGLLCEEEVAGTLEIARVKPLFQTERRQAEFALIESNMNQRLTEVKATLGPSRGVTWQRGLIDSIEAFLDAGDAVRRRKTANRIYKDLVAERISHDRAALELKLLNKRQSGGWLAAWLGMRG